MLGPPTIHDPASSSLMTGYDPEGFFDEMFEAPGRPRGHYDVLYELLSRLSPTEFDERREAVNASFRNGGIGFTVYGNDEGVERIFPFDLIPRVIPHSEWIVIERGLAQRATALNQFLADVYHDQRILRDGRIPVELVLGARHFQREMVGLDVPRSQFDGAFKRGHGIFGRLPRCSAVCDVPHSSGLTPFNVA